MEDKDPRPPAPSPQEQYFRLIQGFLDENDVNYRTVNHEATFTSEESARVRGVPLSVGGKALMLKIGGGSGGKDDDDKNDFALFVMSAARKLNSKAIKKEFKSRGRAVKDIRFATAEELAGITGGLVPGCVPPFGKPILKLPSSTGSGVDHGEEHIGDDTCYMELYIDTSITENDTIAFNAGFLTNSIIMSQPDYLRVSAPAGIFNFSKT